MGSTETGEVFTEAQYQSMSVEKREELKLVGLTAEDQAALRRLPNRAARREWMRANKKFKKETL